MWEKEKKNDSFVDGSARARAIAVGKNRDNAATRTRDTSYMRAGYIIYLIIIIIIILYCRRFVTLPNRRRYITYTEYCIVVLLYRMMHEVDIPVTGNGSNNILTRIITCKHRPFWRAFLVCLYEVHRKWSVF